MPYMSYASDAYANTQYQNAKDPSISDKAKAGG